MKAIFLDIDGVLQPFSSQKRFDHIRNGELPNLCIALNKRVSNGFDLYKWCDGEKALQENLRPNELNSHNYDVAAVYWDWHPEAIRLLHQVIDETGAQIVLSSDWRSKGFEACQALLDIHNFGKYLYGTTYFPATSWEFEDLFTRDEQNFMSNDWYVMQKQLYAGLKEIYPDVNDKNSIFSQGFNERTAEIFEYLDRHQEITSYVVVDDLYLAIGQKDHFVYSNRGHILPEHAEKMVAALEIEDGPYPLPAQLQTEQLRQWRRKWVTNSKYRM